MRSILLIMAAFLVSQSAIAQTSFSLSYFKEENGKVHWKLWNPQTKKTKTYAVLSEIPGNVLWDFDKGKLYYQSKEGIVSRDWPSGKNETVVSPVITGKTEGREGEHFWFDSVNNRIIMTYGIPTPDIKHDRMYYDLHLDELQKDGTWKTTLKKRVDEVLFYDQVGPLSVLIYDEIFSDKDVRKPRGISLDLLIAQQCCGGQALEFFETKKGKRGFAYNDNVTKNCGEKLITQCHQALGASRCPQEFICFTKNGKRSGIAVGAMGGYPAYQIPIVSFRDNCEFQAFATGIRTLSENLSNKNITFSFMENYLLIGDFEEWTVLDGDTMKSVLHLKGTQQPFWVPMPD